MSAGRGLRPAHNRDCPRNGADGLSLGLAACRETALAQTAARQHDRLLGSLVLRSHDRLLGSLVLRSAEVVAELGANTHILSGTPEAVGFPDASRCAKQWPWLTLLTHLPKSSSHAVPNHHRSTTPASIRAPRRAHPSLSARLSLLLEPNRSRVARGRNRRCDLGTGICRGRGSRRAPGSSFGRRAGGAA